MEFRNAQKDYREHLHFRDRIENTIVTILLSISCGALGAVLILRFFHA